MGKHLAALLIACASVNANSAVIAYEGTFVPGDGVPEWASSIAGSVTAEWDTVTESFVTFQATISGFQADTTFIPGILAIESYRPVEAETGQFFDIQSAPLGSPGYTFDSWTGTLYINHDGYTPTAGLYGEQYAELEVAKYFLSTGAFTVNLLPNVNCSGCTGVSGTLATASMSAVPVPAAAWLFGSALAGLGWMRRKQAI